MDPVNPSGISKLFQFFHCFFRMLLLVGEKEDLCSIVLEDMSDYTEANASRAAGDNVNLAVESARGSRLHSRSIRQTFPARSGISLSGSNLLPVRKDMLLLVQWKFTGHSCACLPGWRLVYQGSITEVGKIYCHLHVGHVCTWPNIVTTE